MNRLRIGRQKRRPRVSLFGRPTEPLERQRASHSRFFSERGLSRLHVLVELNERPGRIAAVEQETADDGVCRGRLGRLWKLLRQIAIKANRFGISARCRSSLADAKSTSAVTGAGADGCAAGSAVGATVGVSAETAGVGRAARGAASNVGDLRASAIGVATIESALGESSTEGCSIAACSAAGGVGTAFATLAPFAETGASVRALLSP